MVKSKEFVGKVQLAAGNLLWLHPISSFKSLKELNMIVIDECVRNELVSSKYAIEFESHLNSLKEIFSECGMSIASQEDKQLNLEIASDLVLESLLADVAAISYAYLNSNDQINQVYVSAVDTPAKFFVQNSYSYELLSRLNSDIKQYLKNLNDYEIRVQNLLERTKKKDEYEINEEKMFEDFLKRTNQARDTLTKEIFDLLKSKKKKLFCLAKLTKEDQFFRAEIVDYRQKENKQEDELKVFFVDYGDFNWISKNEIFPLSERFLKILPFQAIECSLDGVIMSNNRKQSEICDDGWSFEAGDAMWDMTHDENNVHLNLYTQVNSVLTQNQQQSQNARNLIDLSLKKYSIKLFKRKLPGQIEIAHELVKSGWATFNSSEEEKIFLSSRFNRKENSSIVKNLSLNAEQFIANFIRQLNTLLNMILTIRTN